MAEFIVHLTPEEQAMLDGKEGRAKQIAMRFLVDYARALGADHFVNVDYSAMALLWPEFDGMSLGRECHSAEEEFRFQDMGTEEEFELSQFETHRCSFMCGSLSKEYLSFLSMDEDQDLVRQCGEAIEFSNKMGAVFHGTCAPPLIGHVATFGEHIITVESSHAILANSVFGARANPEGSVSAACATICGRVPYFGFHVPENRYGTHLIKVDCIPQDCFEWDTLGAWVGEQVGVGIPVLDIDVPSINLECHESLSAAIITYGEVSMYKVLGLTPEAMSWEQAFGPNDPGEAIHYTEADQNSMIARISTAQKGDEVDMVIVGCPHLGIFQLKELAQKLRGKHLKKPFLVQTAHQTYEQAAQSWFLEAIMASGAAVVPDSCPTLTKNYLPGLKVVATPSFKQAKFIPGDILNCKMAMGNLDACIRAAETGVWEGGRI